jgi:phage major head subunit gpT-like protein
MASSGAWAELLSPGLRSIFFKQVDSLTQPSRIPILFNVMGSTKASEDFLGVGGFGDWTAYTGEIDFDDFNQGYKTTLTHVEYTKGFKVERKLYDDDQYNIINQRPEGLAMGAVRTREKHGVSVFNNAFSSSYTGGDSVSLCNASHPYSPVNATTQSNTGTTALSYDAIIATKKLMREYKDDRGELITVMPNTLLVPPELEDTAWTIVSSMNKPGTADNDANYVRSQGWNVVVWDLLTDANNWFMIDSGLAKRHLIWLNRSNLEFAMDPASDFNLEARYRGYMRYSYGWSDWVWIYGHNVT